jgi:hypothetical protein
MPEDPPRETSIRERSFVSDLSESVRLLDILLITVVPLILFLLSQLPDTTHRSLAFNPDTPTVLSSFTAHFVHFDGAHLSGNLWMYLLVLPMVYLLFALSDRRRDFFLIGGPILFVAPFLLSGLNLLLPKSGAIIVGFSGLAMAFVGVLPVALFRFLEDTVPRAIGLTDALSLFFIGAALIAFRMAPFGIGLVIGIPTGLIALLFTWRLLRKIRPLQHGELGRTLRNTGYIELAATAPIVFVVATFMAFPADPFQYGGVIDLPTHLFGYLLGFLWAFLLVEVTDFFEDEKVPEPPDSFEEWDFPDSPD